MHINFKLVFTGMLCLFPALLLAQDDDKAAKIAAAEAECIAAAQERYGVAADNVLLRNSRVKWNSGLGGYRVDLKVTKKNGRSDNTACVYKDDGSLKFYAD